MKLQVISCHSEKICSAALNENNENIEIATNVLFDSTEEELFEMEKRFDKYLDLLKVKNQLKKE